MKKFIWYLILSVFGLAISIGLICYLVDRPLELLILMAILAILIGLFILGLHLAGLWERK